MHIRGMLSDQIKEFLVDPLNLSTKGVIESRTSDTKTTRGKVLRYDPETHSVEVATTPAQTDSSGNLRGLVMKCTTNYVGPVSGTGSADSKFLYQPVHLKFEQGASTGIFSRGIAGESVYHEDQLPPLAGSWRMAPTGVVNVFSAAGNNLGTVEHTDGNSNKNKITVGHKNDESWGNENVMATGHAETFLEKQIKNGVDSLAAAAERWEA